VAAAAEAAARAPTPAGQLLLLLVFVLVKRGINADLLMILIAVGGLLHKSRCAAYEYICRSRRF
jgi:hypothetical protein